MSRTFHHGATKRAGKVKSARKPARWAARRTATRQAVVAAALRGDL